MEILAIRGLAVRFSTADGVVEAVRGLDLDVAARDTVAIVGESGSGKSQTVMAAMGLLARNGHASGSVRYRGREMIGASTRSLNEVRGRHIGMIFQEPMTSLDPLQPIGRQIAEPIVYHQKVSWRVAKARALELMQKVQIASAAERLAAYPHELSGGQRQRVMIAMALANDPDLLIADEPTTALDVTIQAEILKLLAALQAELGMAILFITHDLALVRRIAHRVTVMRLGEAVEQGPVDAVFRHPEHPYTKMLIAAEPTGRKAPVPAGAPVLLEGRAITVRFEQPGFLFGRGFSLTAVDGVDLAVKRGETLGVVGESGSGKSTLGRALLRLLPSQGTIRFEGRDISKLDLKREGRLRRDLQLVFQDPFGSLSPRLTAGEIVSEGLLVHEPRLTAAERDRAAAKAFAEVQLDPALRRRYPHEFSGGQRQRIAIARTMILKPRLVVLDEPTSALDRSVQKEIVELLRALQQAHGLTYLFISHDLAVVRAMADTILVMKDGKVVERGTLAEIFGAPREDYTRRLLGAAAL